MPVKRKFTGNKAVRELEAAYNALSAKGQRAFIRAAKQTANSPLFVEALEQLASRGSFTPEMADRLASTMAVDAPMPAIRDVVQDAMKSGSSVALKSVNVSMSFDYQSPAVAEYLSTYGANLLEANKATRAAVREAIVRAYEEGLTPAELAQRLKDYVGLAPRHLAAVDKYRAMQIASGRTKTQANASARRYANELLSYRAMTIARTEVMRAQNFGQLETWRQMRAKGYVPTFAMREWSANPRNCCDLCSAMHGKRTTLDGVWMTPIGPVDVANMHPNCRCSELLVDGDEVSKANPYRDAIGRYTTPGRAVMFAPADMPGGGSALNRRVGPSKHYAEAKKKPVKSKKKDGTLNRSTAAGRKAAGRSDQQELQHKDPRTGKSLPEKHKSKVGTVYEEAMQAKVGKKVAKALGGDDIRVLSGRQYQNHPWDGVTVTKSGKDGSHLVEIKSLNIEGSRGYNADGTPKRLKGRISAAQRKTKTEYAAKHKKKMAMVIQVVNDDRFPVTVDVYLHAGSLSAGSPFNFEPGKVASYSLSKTEWLQGMRNHGIVDAKGEVVKFSDDYEPIGDSTPLDVGDLVIEVVDGAVIAYTVGGPPSLPPDYDGYYLPSSPVSKANRSQQILAALVVAKREQLRDPNGGLTAAGRRHFKEKEGANLKPGVKGPADTPEKMRRKGSFLTRFYTNPSGPLQDSNGNPTRLALAAKAWGEPAPKTAEDAKRLAEKGRRLLARYEELKKYNKNHDRLGRFTTAGGAVAMAPADMPGGGDVMSRDGVVMTRVPPVAELAAHLGDPSADYSEVRAVPVAKRKRIAATYDSMPDVDERAKAAYDELGKIVDSQFDTLTRMGIRIEFTANDPYPDIHALRADFAKNRRIKVLRTASTGSHPYWSDETNDRFRAVHDAFGHLATGRGFDRHGEEAAYQAHKSMMPESVHGVLAMETRGQNSYLIDRGIFPAQKVGALPAELTKQLLAALFKAETVNADDDNLYAIGRSHHVTGGRHFAHDTIRRRAD